MKNEIIHKGERFYYWGTNSDGTYTFVNNRMAAQFGARFIVKKLKTIIVRRNITFRKKIKVEAYRQSAVDLVNAYRKKHKVRNEYA